MFTVESIPKSIVVVQRVRTIPLITANLLVRITESLIVQYKKGTDGPERREGLQEYL